MNAGMKMLAVNNAAKRGRGGARSEMRGAEQGYGRSEMRSGGNYGRSEMGYGNMGYGEMGGGEMGYGEMENRFRDRRGREHYDNGRFAPMRGAMGEMEGRYGGGRSSPRSEMGEMEGRYEGRSRARGWAPEYEARYMAGMARNGGEREMMAGFSTNGGFRDNGMDASYQPTSEVGFMAGAMERGHSHSAMVRPFDKQLAEEWTKSMENEDGSKGPHWTLEQAKQVMAQRGVSLDPFQFWAALNAMYSDYSKVFRKHGVGDKMDLYVDMAKAFIEDKDAQPEKLSRYYEYVVKH